ncbi:hypothetical protein THAOC_34827 [Thalassiosira oceanica]|uniref:Uncharacterized protein n=1 Tax=Thalassiosira oceanica TaxID=159749 RepID=K0RBN4_THAOC|nr:hypothetical protein THAOC_34827 [Thalassiosira oceanica]|eukprot:EJK46501.1 hypothetical protein THAOC_34827 [Thalassiosira oceanica]
MLDVLSSGGVTNGQALAQGPYLKIRWAVGVSRGRKGGRGGTVASTMEALGCFPLKFSAAKGVIEKSLRAGTSPGGFVMCPPEGISRKPAAVDGRSSAILLVRVDYLLPQKVVLAGSATQNSPYTTSTTNPTADDGFTRVGGPQRIEYINAPTIGENNVHPTTCSASGPQESHGPRARNHRRNTSCLSTLPIPIGSGETP